MANFDALYKQTVTMFNRRTVGDSVIWYPIILEKVHLVTDKSIIIGSYGEQSQDNARLHVRYSWVNGKAVVNGKTYMTPKVWEREGDPMVNFTIGYGDSFDFFIEGIYRSSSSIDDEAYRNGFYNYMNKEYDSVYAISTVSQFNLIPHFEIGAK